MTKYCEDIVNILNQYGDSARAAQMKRYMKNKFEFFGIPSPKLRQLSAPFLQRNNLPDAIRVPELAREFWNHQERELQYFSIELLKKYLRHTPIEWIDLYEELITQKSWWDTVDGLAAWQVGDYFKKYPDQIFPRTNKWMNSGKIWLQRTCLIFQLKYKEDTDFELLKSFIIPLSDSKAFFIQKAIGWTLREYSKLFPQRVMDFADNQPMAKLSYREATRNRAKKVK
jgi:3-methyladenine DNA glycosylase AlkD